MIDVRAGDQFALGFDTSSRNGNNWQEAGSGDVVSLLSTQLAAYPPAFQPATTWFLFKAMQAGETRITFTYKHVGVTLDEKILTVDVK